MRTIKELLQIILDNQNYFSTGLCNWVYMCHLNDLINLEEYLCLRDYILDRKSVV